jgi:hypothetical protein
MNLGARYKLTKHPYQPIGRALDYDIVTGEVLVEWDDQTLIPPRDHYPQEMFSDGTFVLVEEHGQLALLPKCIHRPKQYVGFREAYTYCEKCGVKLS